MNKKKFDIEGMTCAACQLTVEKAVKKLGYKQVNVSLLTNTLEVLDDNINDNEIIQSIKNVGYEAKRKKNISKNKKNINPKDKLEKYAIELKSRLLVSIPLMILLMYIAMGEMMNLPYPNILKGYQGAGLFSLIQIILTIPIIYTNKSYFINGFKTLLKKHPNMDSLVAIGSSSAVFYGVFATIMINYGLGINDQNIVLHYRHDLYFEAATMILTLITLGHYLEAKSKVKTTDSINKLIEMQPDTVTIIKNGVEEIVLVEDLNINDIIKIVPGDRLAVDGIIIEGNSSLDTSAITGESMPIGVKKNSQVISGSVNINGSFLMKATTVGSDTTISKIISLMEEASATKAPISKLADKVSSIFVPIVIILSVLSFIIWLSLGAKLTFALSIAIGVLVISCPCALGLATPIAMMVATGKAAENGILIKNSESLEILHNIDAIIFDKTGTITEGKPSITDLITINNNDKFKVLEIAASLESKSEHPLSKAILKLANKKEIKIKNVKQFESITGKGIEGIIENKKYFIGNEKLLKEKLLLNYSIKKIEKLSKQGKTVIYLFDENEILAIFAIADKIKNTSKIAIENIKKYGIETIMLTGDNKLTAKYIADYVGIDNFRSELLPQDKESIVREYQNKGQKVAMVGDGINDAPSLIRADIGIAIANGTDIAIESADLVLMKSNLMDIVSAIKLSEATIKNIKQNLFWAFFYNVISIPLALGVFYPIYGIKLNPMIGAFAMSLSSIFVVTNSLRLKKLNLYYKKQNEDIIFNENINCDNININTETKYIGEENMKELIVNIEGMSCMHCKKSIEKALSNIAKKVEVSLEDKNAKILVDDKVKDHEIIDLIEEQGYEVVSIEQ